MRNTIKYISSIFAFGIISILTAFGQNVGSGIERSKTVTSLGNGNYELTLEAFATGMETYITKYNTTPVRILVIVDNRGQLNGSVGDEAGYVLIQKGGSAFMDALIKADGEDGTTNFQNHKIGVIQRTDGTISFSKDYSTVNNYFKNFSTASNGQVISTMFDMATTYFKNNPDYYIDEEGKQCQYSNAVVFVSRGETANNNKYSKADADKITAAAKNTKDYATVFTLCLNDDPVDGIITFMQATATKPEFSYLAQNLDEMIKNFSSIAEQTISGGSTTQLTEKNSSIRDYITPQFKLTDGTVSSITTYYAESNGSADNWKTPTPTGTEITATLGTPIDGITEVIIRGFSFRDNWVGPSPEGFHNGKKIIIKIKISLDNTVQDLSGFMETNTAESGIYSADSENEGEETKEYDFTPTGINFDVPVAVSPIAVLHIVKTGLNAGESAVFTIDGDDNTHTVMVNSTTPDAYVLVNWLKTGSVKKSAAEITVDDMRTFTVTETTWTWTNTNERPIEIERVLMNKNNGVWEPVDFEFGHGTRTTTIKYDEDSKVITSKVITK